MEVVAGFWELGVEADGEMGVAVGAYWSGSCVGEMEEE